MNLPAPPDREAPQSAPEPLRIVVDANITLAMFLARRNPPAAASSKRLLLSLLSSSMLHWLWSPDILADYEHGAHAIENDVRIQRRAAFDRVGFEIFLAALQLLPAVHVTATTLRAARRRINQAATERDRDLDDAIYLACAVDGKARLLTSEDSDILSLGKMYEEVEIVNWAGFVDELRQRQLLK
ncbi:MAG: PIN domain-containing protein [Blastocatellia bacterium]|nr:PIN domain-containing protein [Blastocatellia bacterium]